jgi:hypothetical protein
MCSFGDPLDVKYDCLLEKHHMLEDMYEASQARIRELLEQLERGAEQLGARRDAGAVDLGRATRRTVPRGLSVPVSGDTA